VTDVVLPLLVSSGDRRSMLGTVGWCRMHSKLDAHLSNYHEALEGKAAKTYILSYLFHQLL